MRNLKLYGILAVLMVFGMVCTASADPIVLSPESALLVATGNETSVPEINDAVLASLGFSLSDNELYKQDAGALSDEGVLASSYETVFNGDLSGGTITYVGGSYVMNPVYLLVKDGNNSPAWYLFDISGWNGTDTIILSDFWPGNGSISHVSFAGDGIYVPEPSSLLLLGSGLLAFGLVGRRWFKS